VEGGGGSQSYILLVDSSFDAVGGSIGSDENGVYIGD
jgi:hypothetical protein